MTLFLITGSLFTPKTASAADVRTGETVIISGTQPLTDPYLFGSTIDLSAPVANDLVTAGGTINISGNITNDLLAAGGTITLHGKVGNTVRVAGGNITIDGPIARDLVIAGGTIIVNKTASIGGDVLMAGGQLDMEGPVKGKILASGGNLTLNNAVGGNVLIGQVKNLALGPQARINGNLTYSSSQTLTRDSTSVVKGQTTYHYVAQKEPRHAEQTAFGFSLYRLIAAIILSLLFIYFFRAAILSVFSRMEESPGKSGLIGLLAIIVAPVMGIILLILFLLGIAFFISYGLALILSIMLTNVYTGWWVLRWWERRNKKIYTLDWRAGVVGPLIITILLWIPVLGWLFCAIVFLVVLGALLSELATFMPLLQGTNKKSRLN